MSIAFRSLSVLFAAAALLVVTSRAQAVLVPTTIFSETFDTNSANAAVTYPAFTFLGLGTDTASGGNLVLTNPGGGSNRDVTFTTNQVFSGEKFTVKGRVNQTDGSVGGTANGIVIGNRAFTFFGNFPGAFQGAFNIINVDTATGQNVGTLLGDTDMTFVPAQGVFHSYTIDYDPTIGAFGQMAISVQNGGGAGTFNYNWAIDGGFVAGGVGFFNWAAAHTTLFDDLQVIALRELVVPVPEPSMLSLLGLGAAGVAMLRRRRVRS